MKDRPLGALIFAISILGMIGYFYWLFLSPDDVTFLGKSLGEWAIIVPVFILVYALFFVIAWIGWALASTAPPLPITEESTED